jgi:hypothetical protein
VKLPNVENAVVSEDKVVGYLLNPAHADGAAKARFFTAIGFSVANWQMLAAALQEIAARNELARNVESPHGVKYIVEGPINSPCGESPFVRTVWIIDNGQSIPRLVTAYPHLPESEDA